MTTTTHHAVCTCCGGELTIAVDDAGTWSPSECDGCHQTPLSMSPETHAALMAEHERAKKRGDVAHQEFPRIEA